jgi:hypothetical protein
MQGREGPGQCAHPKHVVELEELSLCVLLPNHSHLCVAQVRLRLRRLGVRYANQSPRDRLQNNNVNLV